MADNIQYWKGAENALLLQGLDLFYWRRKQSIKKEREKSSILLWILLIYHEINVLFNYNGFIKEMKTAVGVLFNH